MQVEEHWHLEWQQLREQLSQGKLDDFSSKILLNVGCTIDIANRELLV